MIPHNLSVTVHRFIINTSQNLEDFALKTKNCVLTNESDWRCTYYGVDFTSNIFIAKKLSYYALVSMSFSKNKTLEEYQEAYRKIFGEDVTLQDFTLINRVDKFYTPFKSLDLEKLESILSGDDKDIFIKMMKKKGPIARPDKIKSYHMNDNKRGQININKENSDSPAVNMDQQRFSALSLKPFPQESNFTIEVFTSGNLNVAGVPGEEYLLNRIVPYVNDKLVNMLSKCEINTGGKALDDLIDEFDF